LAWSGLSGPRVARVGAWHDWHEWWFLGFRIIRVGDWRAWLLDEDDPAVRLLRDRTRTGRPCGPAEFVARLENLLGRPLAPRKRGRKPKRKKPNAEKNAPSP